MLMKKIILIGATALLAGPLFAADSSPKDDIINAAQKLAAGDNYSWHTTVVVPEGSRFRPGPTDGKTEKDGYTYVKMSFGGNDTEIVMKGDNAAVTDPNGGWQSLADLAGDDQGPGRFLVGMIRNFKAPAAQVTNLVAAAKEIKTDGDACGGDLTEAGAKALLSFGPRGGGASITNAEGSVKFWVKDGALVKFEFKVKGTVDFNGNSRDVDRDTTVEIKDIGATKVEVPDDAKKKLSH
jgi:hypothetical protein